MESLKQLLAKLQKENEEIKARAHKPVPELSHEEVLKKLAKEMALEVIEKVKPSTAQG